MLTCVRLGAGAEGAAGSVSEVVFRDLLLDGRSTPSWNRTYFGQSGGGTSLLSVRIPSRADTGIMIHHGPCVCRHGCTTTDARRQRPPASHREPTKYAKYIETK